MPYNYKLHFAFTPSFQRGHLRWTTACGKIERIHYEGDNYPYLLSGADFHLAMRTLPSNRLCQSCVDQVGKAVLEKFKGAFGEEFILTGFEGRPGWYLGRDDDVYRLCWWDERPSDEAVRYEIKWFEDNRREYRKNPYKEDKLTLSPASDSTPEQFATLDPASPEAASSAPPHA